MPQSAPAAGQTASPQDAWRLAEALKDSVVVVEERHCCSFILHTNRPPSWIYFSEKPMTPWQEAFVLAHELGHHLLTPFTRVEREAMARAAAAVQAGEPGYELHWYPVERRLEFLANAFAFGFLFDEALSCEENWERLKGGE